jgi:hypothetical protein
VTDDALPICQECGEVFSTPRGLSSHLKKHSKPTICPRCGESVRYLAAHLQNKHPLSKQHEHLLVGVQQLIEENRTLRQQLTDLAQKYGDSDILHSLSLTGERGMDRIAEYRVEGETT